MRPAKQHHNGQHGRKLKCRSKTSQNEINSSHRRAIDDELMMLNLNTFFTHFHSVSCFWKCISYLQCHPPFEYHRLSNKLLLQNQSNVHQFAYHHAQIAASIQSMCSSWKTVIASMHPEFAQASPQNHSENWIVFSSFEYRNFPIF